MLVGQAKILTKSTDDILKIRSLGRPFGSVDRKDTHGEFFSPKTYCGDDLKNTRFSTYSHMAKSKNNPYGKPTINSFPLGVATHDGIDEAGHWFVHEIAKAKEYRPYISALAEMGLLGSSSQALLTGKSVNKETGELIRWIDGEIALLVNPSGYDTVGHAKVLKVAELETVDTVWKAIQEAAHKHLVGTPMWKQIEDYLKLEAETTEDEETPDPTEPTEEKPTVITISTEQMSELSGIPEKVNAATHLQTEALADIQAAVKTVSELKTEIDVLKSALDSVSEMKDDILALKQTLVTHAYAVTKSIPASTPPGAKTKSKTKPETPDPDKKNMKQTEGGGTTAGGLPMAAPGGRR